MDDMIMDEMTMGDMVISDNNAFLMAMGEGSRIEIHAADAVKDSWTQIDQSADAGDTTITLAESQGWQVGDKIAIASTGFDMEEAEERTITAISSDGKTVTFDQPLEHDHFGEVETHDNGKTGADFQSWEMDMRAEVALLSRNVTIQGDADSADDGYGGHTMVMNGAEMHIDGAEFTQMGQEGILGRYALHWHMLEDAAGQYITKASIHDIYNKGITIHGTQNTWVENNVVFETIGHSFYFEDGSEFGNVLKDNLGFNTRAADSLDNAPIGSDVTAPSTFWITNPNNHFLGNTAAGSEGTGFWILSQEHVEGLSSASGLYDDYIPRAQNGGQWIGNTSHSNAVDGLFIGRQFDESNGDAAGDPPLEMTFALTDFTTYKNEEFGIWLRNGHGNFSDLKIAESNVGIQMWGASSVEDSLILGSTSNFDMRPGGEHAGWQLYDQAVDFYNVHFDGFDDAGDAAIANGWGFGRSAQYTAEGLTFGDNVDADKIYNAMLTISSTGFSDIGGTISGGLYDVDGAISGTAGAVLTVGIVDEHPDEHTDIPNYAYNGIDASGFNATQGAEYQADTRTWVHQPDSIIGKMSIREEERDGNDYDSVSQDDRTEYTIAKSDNGAALFMRQDSIVSYAQNVQLNLDASGDIEYTISYDDGLPEAVNIEVMDLPKGATAYYRFTDLPDGVVFQKADALANIAAVRAADVTSWTRDSNGDYLVKVVADVFFPWRTVATSGEDTAQENIYNDGFKIIIGDRANAEASGNQGAYFNPDEHILEEANPDALPDRGESTSDTTVVTDGMPRWSDTDAWGDAGVPGRDDIVVINAGETVVLDASSTVQGIIVNGGELIIEDDANLTIDLAADYVLVINGGLFQAGTEDDPLDTAFTLTLEGDDPDFDLHVTDILMGRVANTVFADGETRVVETPVDPEDGLGIQVDTLTVSQPDADTWFTVTFDTPIEDAVVIMGPVEDEGSNPAMTRVRNVSETGFEFQIDEWQYDDGWHVPVEVTWMAASAGDYVMEDGRHVSFGEFTAEDESIASVTLHDFDDGPVVVTQVGGRDSDAVTTRVSDVDANGFNVRMQEEEASNGNHVAESVYWMAVEEGDGDLNAFQFTGVDHNGADFGMDLPDHLLAAMQTFEGNNTAVLRYGEADNGNLSIHVQEERSADNEVWHLEETIGAIHTNESFIALDFV